MGKPITDPLYFYTHDNGGRAYKVVIDNLHLAVYKPEWSDCECPEHGCKCEPHDVRICQYDCLDIFIGKSPLNVRTMESGGHGPSYDGNSILALLDDENKYIYLFVGTEVVTFELDSKIILFLSPVGPNDVPCPYAITEHGEFIMLLDYKTFHFDPYSYVDNIEDDVKKLSVNVIPD